MWYCPLPGSQMAFTFSLDVMIRSLRLIELAVKFDLSRSIPGGGETFRFISVEGIFLRGFLIYFSADLALIEGMLGFY